MSTSNKFHITYPSGLGSHVEVCDAQTVEEFANRHFGSVDYKEHGITVEMEPVEAEEAEFNGIPTPAVTVPVVPVLQGDDPIINTEPNDDDEKEEDEA